jgi:outer membrane protein OmpA-like peptidoglycan-associated protein
MSQLQDQQDENHWPGYVDALTTMLMVLTFVMMILGIAVFSTSQNASRILIEAIARAARVDPPIENIPVSELTDKILDKLRRHPPRPPVAAETPVAEQERLAQGAGGVQPLIDPTRTVVSAAPAAVEAARPAETQRQGTGFLVTFQPRATRLDDAAQERLKETLDAAGDLRSAATVEIRAFVDGDTTGVTDAQRIAYYRAMAVRTAVMAAGVPPGRLRVLLDRAPLAGAASDLVRIVVVPPT